MAYYTANIPPELKEDLDAAIAKKQKPASQKSEEEEEEEEDEEDKEEKVFEMFDRMVTRLESHKPAAFLSTAPDATTGIVFNIEGESAYATYESEHGVHAFLEGKAVHNILVDTSEISFKDYKPPSSLERRGSITLPVTVKVAAAFTIAPMVTLKIECSTIAEIGRATPLKEFRQRSRTS